MPRHAGCDGRWWRTAFMVRQGVTGVAACLHWDHRQRCIQWNKMTDLCVSTHPRRCLRPASESTGHVALSPLCVALMDSLPFQRLRRLEQLGLTSMVSSSACMMTGCAWLGGPRTPPGASKGMDCALVASAPAFSDCPAVSATDICWWLNAGMILWAAWLSTTHEEGRRVGDDSPVARGWAPLGGTRVQILLKSVPAWAASTHPGPLPWFCIPLLPPPPPP